MLSLATGFGVGFGFGPLRFGFLLDLVQGGIGCGAVGLASGFGIGLDLGTRGCGLAKGAQDFTLALQKIRFGHSSPQTALNRLCLAYFFGGCQPAATHT